MTVQFFAVLVLLLLFYWLYSAEDVKMREDNLISVIKAQLHQFENYTFLANNSFNAPTDVISAVENVLFERNDTYFQNLTGFFQGRWERNNQSFPTVLPDFPKYPIGDAIGPPTSNSSGRNSSIWEDLLGDDQFIFGDNGTVFMELLEKPSNDTGVTILQGQMYFRDGFEKSLLTSYPTFGVYLPEKGLAFLHAGTGPVVPDGLMHILQNRGDFGKIYQSILYWMNSQIITLINALNDPLNSREEIVIGRTSSRANCTFRIYFQVQPFPNGTSKAAVIEMEKEMERPEGISVMKAPHIMMKGVVYSPECGFFLSLDTNGYKIERFHTKAIRYGALVVMIICAQMYFILRQIRHTSTPAGLGRVSLLAFGMLAANDLLLCLWHSSNFQSPVLFPLFSFITFLYFVQFVVLQMRYVFIIWMARWRPNDGSDDIRRAFSSLYIRFYGYMFAFLVFYYITKSTQFHWFAMFVYSNWIPQIVFNVRRNATKSLDIVFLVGFSASRLLLGYYYFICPENILFNPLDVTLAIAVTVFVILQILILLAQDKYGPRFFLPSKFLPHTYDYHRPLAVIHNPFHDTDSDSSQRHQDESDEDNLPIESDIDLEKGLPHSGKRRSSRKLLGSKSSRRRSKSTDAEKIPLQPPAQSTDCVICMQAVDSSVAGRQYMLTPCNHLFHSECLQQWMKSKLVCPTCRGELPEMNWKFFENGYNVFAAQGAGALFAIAWWILIDAHIMANKSSLPAAEQVVFLHYVPGLLSTLALICINILPHEAFFPDSFLDSEARQGYLCAIGVAFTLGFSGLIGSAWLMIARYLTIAVTDTWPGIAVFLQNSMLITSLLILRFGRNQEAAISLG